MENPSKENIPWYFTLKSVFLGLALVGPLALPLVWWTPRLSKGKKWTLTVITLVLAVVFFKLSQAAFVFLNEKMQELQTAGF